MKTIMVVGAGQMGSGIAQVAAMSGFSVIVHDVKEAQVEQARQSIDRRLARQVAKGRLTEDEKSAALSRVRLTTQLEDAQEADVVIEAVTEQMDVKCELFRQLDQHAPPDAIFASNTSSLPITEMAAVTRRPEQVIGMHFMNPVPVMELVEIIRGLQTSDAVYREVEQLARAMGKTPVEVKDFPGFVSNRVLLPMINEAIFAVYEGVATKEDVDQVMKLGMNHPMGPILSAWIRACTSWRRYLKGLATRNTVRVRCCANT